VLRKVRAGSYSQKSVRVNVCLSVCLSVCVCVSVSISVYEMYILWRSIVYLEDVVV